MQTIRVNPQLKQIAFKSFEKYFQEALSSPDDDTIIFYKELESGFSISFSWDNFIIETSISNKEIIDRYADTYPDTIEVATDTTGRHPAIVKFMDEFLSRGIPEQ